MASEFKERSLEETSTWAVALVCAVFIIISILIEHGIHSLHKWFQKKQKKAMLEALEKIKAELMLLGFISFLLAVGTIYVTKICIPLKLANTMLPCGKNGYSKDGGSKGGDDNKRKLLSFSEYHHHDDIPWHRMLAGDKYGEYCSEKEKVTLISYKGLHQLHIFIFVLAVFHILYSVIIIALSQAKMKKWKGWELETSSLEYEFSNDPSRFRLAHQTSFVRRHAGFSRMPGLRWIVAFFRQFFGSVSKVDYITMRHGFINAHLAPNSKFDFHKYIKRSMEDDFKVVVGISILLWIYTICLLFLNVYGWYIIAWVSFIPLATLLVVGTKLELVIMEMAQQIQDRTTIVLGAPIVEPSNSYFWFNNPRWILVLIHLTSFQNAFQLAYFLWAWYEFGFYSCHSVRVKLVFTVLRVALGIALQFICSYITFPLYVLVTQMGSHMKRVIFEEQTAKALKKWQKAAKDRKKTRSEGNDISYSGFTSGNTTPSRGSSPTRLLHKDNNYKPSDQHESVPNSSTSYQSEDEADYSSHNGRNITITQPSRSQKFEKNHEIDFSFEP